jgi:putative peptidoglycan lipid II flippase
MLTIVYAVIGVYFPLLASEQALGNNNDFAKNIKELMQYVLFLILPAACGFIILRYDIMDFLLNWRQNAGTDIIMAGNMLGIYSIGMLAISFKEVLDRAFYAGKDTKTPAFFGLGIMLVNITVTLLLVDHLGVYAMPIANGISVFFGAGGLFAKLIKKVKLLDFRFIFVIFRNVLAAALMAFAVYIARDYISTLFMGYGMFIKLTRLMLSAVTGAFVYFAACFLLRLPVIYMIIKRGK